MDIQLLDLQTVLRKYGRGVLLYAHDGTGPSNIGNPVRWDAASEIQLAHLGDTEGDITFTPNDTVATLTLPEISGQAIYEGTYTGEGPQLTFPLFMADPNLFPIVSPIGQAGAGFTRVRDVSERTLVLMPEELFRDDSTDPATYKDLTYNGTAWLLGGVALTAAQQVLLALSVWCWRGFFNRPEKMFLGGHGDDGKNIVPVTFNLMMHPDIPDGQRLYTVGDPTLAANGSIPIDGGS